MSGIFFTYDISKPPGNRVESKVVKVQDEYLNLKKIYRLATNTFLKNVDAVLKETPVLVSKRI